MCSRGGPLPVAKGHSTFAPRGSVRGKRSTSVMPAIEVVIGDVHARAPALAGLLAALGAIDKRGRRRRGWWIVQLGDLLDRRATAEDNLATATIALACVDVVLAGNHEARMLGD